jgi:uracil-DNA glycosylase
MSKNLKKSSNKGKSKTIFSSDEETEYRNIVFFDLFKPSNDSKFILSNMAKLMLENDKMTMEDAFTKSLKMFKKMSKLSLDIEPVEYQNIIPFKQSNNSKFIFSNMKKIMLENETMTIEDALKKSLKLFKKMNKSTVEIIDNVHSKQSDEVDATNYSYKSWTDYFKNQEVNLKSLIKNNSWDDFFEIIGEKPYFHNIEKILYKLMINNPNKVIVPYPELLFHQFNILSLDDIKVIIIAQDPYINVDTINDIDVPQAMGVAFSAPLNSPTPKSLLNIYKNLLDFDHVNKIPKTGYLMPWVKQGVFLLNSALTTFLSESNAHQNVWPNFTNDLIEYINENTKNIVFLVWGKDAFNKCKNINNKKHHLIVSSHPSPFSYDNTMTGITKKGDPITFPSFRSTDHFGKTNNYLKTNNKEPIKWEKICD